MKKWKELQEKQTKLIKISNTIFIMFGVVLMVLVAVNIRSYNSEIILSIKLLTKVLCSICAGLLLTAIYFLVTIGKIDKKRIAAQWEDKDWVTKHAEIKIAEHEQFIRAWKNVEKQFNQLRK